MILDTTYLLPLAQIAIDTDLLAAAARGEVELRLEDVTVSLISIFELQAKAAKLKVPPSSTAKAARAILTSFRVEPFFNGTIIEASYNLRKLIPDYLDCVIVATAIVSREDLVTEDSLILTKSETIRKMYGIRTLNFGALASKRLDADEKLRSVS
jgi:PIN domain nuclease of toxin-antitoxin system